MKKYEYTRKEIYQWLKEQNWECKELEEILLAPADKPKENEEPTITISNKKGEYVEFKSNGEILVNYEVADTPLKTNPDEEGTDNAVPIQPMRIVKTKPEIEKAKKVIMYSGTERYPNLKEIWEKQCEIIDRVNYLSTYQK